MKLGKLCAAMALVSLAGTVSAEDRGERMRVDKQHVNNWNNFARQALDLHKKQIKANDVSKTEKFGGYDSDPEFYRELTYTDKKTGKMLSRVQWEKKNPDKLHSVEVFVYDSKGRLARDYAAAFLPGKSNAPVQTLINLHQYNGGLRAFRQFDASSDVIYEYCEGEYKGKPQQIRLFEDDLTATDYDSRMLLKSPEYKACFKGMPKQLGKYIRPQ